MRFHLETNRSNFKQRFQGGLSSEIWVPLNAGRYVGNDAQNTLFKNHPSTDSIKLTDWITSQLSLGNITVSTGSENLVVGGDAEVTGDIIGGGDIVITETVTTPATSATYSIKTAQIVHTTTAAATNTIDIDVPIGAKLIGASVIVTEDLVFAGGGVSAELTWTTSGQVIGTALASQNDKASAFFDENADAAIVAGSVETMTLTPDAGTLGAAGELTIMAVYAELTDFSDVA